MCTFLSIFYHWRPFCCWCSSVLRAIKYSFGVGAAKVRRDTAKLMLCFRIRSYSVAMNATFALAAPTKIVSNNNTQLIFLFAWLESCVVFCCCSFLINYSFEFELDSEIWSTDVNHPQMEINERYTILLFGCFFTKPFLMHS